MSTRLEVRKIFQLSFPKQVVIEKLQATIESHFTNTTFYTANDGPLTWNKLENVPPHVLILTADLARRDGIQIVDHLLTDKRFEETAVIFLCNPPEHHVFMDEIIGGRVQFIGESPDSVKLLRAVNQALNYSSAKQPEEFHLKFLSDGERLMKEGDKADFVYLVRSGRLEAAHKDDKSNALGTIEPGEFVGEMAYINDEPRSADVTAITACELIEIPVNLLDHLLYRRPNWSKALLATLSKRLKRSNNVRRADRT